VVDQLPVTAGVSIGGGSSARPRCSSGYASRSICHSPWPCSPCCWSASSGSVPTAAGGPAGAAGRRGSRCCPGRSRRPARRLAPGRLGVL